MGIVFSSCALGNQCRHKSYYSQLNTICDQTTGPIVWRLDGNEWTK